MKIFRQLKKKRTAKKKIVLTSKPSDFTLNISCQNVTRHLIRTESENRLQQIGNLQNGQKHGDLNTSTPSPREKSE